MDYQTTQPIPSELLEGVTVHVRTPSRRLRARYDMATAPQIAKLRSLAGEREILEPEAKPYRQEAKQRDCTCAHEQFLHDHEQYSCNVPGCDCRQPQFPDALRAKLVDISERENAVIYGEIYPAAFRFWVVTIDGLDISGQAATVDAVLAAEMDLVDEVAMKVDSLIRLSQEERKNSERPTTSIEPVAGPTPPTTAPTVEANGSIVPHLGPDNAMEETAAVSPI